LNTKGKSLFALPIGEGSLKEWVRPLQFLLTIGWFVALSLIIPIGIGYWLDSPTMFDKRPLFTFIGLGIGTVIAFFGLFRMLIRYQAEQERIKKDEK
jgi:hypothetical protein